MDKTILAFHGKFNKPDRKDVSGAFRPECKSFIESMGSGTIFEIDNRQSFSKRRAEVLERFDSEIENGSQFDTIAFFCHGWRNGMEFGFTRANSDELAAAIRDIATTDVVIPLYLCSTGAGPQNGAVSFADSLRDALCRAGLTDCRIMAHRTVAHATRNPDCLFFDGFGSPVGGTGGIPVVGRDSRIWKPWVSALKGAGNLRFRFPFMSIGAIHRELDATG